ncbi:hypothetical protein PoB_003127000, partial [Plakobranchus ocellatus]
TLRNFRYAVIGREQQSANLTVDAPLYTGPNGTSPGEDTVLNTNKRIYLDKWEIFVVNLADKSLLATCKRCQLLKDTWRHNVLTEKMAHSDWEQVPAYAREKLLTILYALRRSAEWLYVTDTAEIPAEDTLLSVCSHQARTAPVYRGPSPVFEPCSHFMDPYIWYGLRKPDTQGQYSIKVVPTDSVHMVVNNCYRRGMDLHKWKEGLDIQAPRPYTMSGTFSSTDFRNVLVSRNMAWALVGSLPLTGTRLSFLTRESVHLSLLVQRVLWESSGVLGFLPSVPPPKTPACPSCAVNATVHEIGLAHLNKLSAWRCKQSNNLLQCFQQLLEDASTPAFLNTTILSSQTRSLVYVWLQMFISQRFPASSRVPVSAEKLAEKDVGIHIQLTAAKSMHVVSPKLSLPPNVFVNLCKTEESKPYNAQIPVNHRIADILLVVIFNFPWLVAHIPTLEYVYGRHFRHVLYCAESTADFHKLYGSRYGVNPVSFVEIPHRAGYWGYDCMTAAARTGYKVAGYLQISDDVIVNVWNLHSLPRGLPWFQSSLKVAQVDRKWAPDVWVTKYWWPWTLFCGQPAAVRVYERLRALRTLPEFTDRIATFLENLYLVTGCDRCLTYEASDIFYLPANLASEFTFFSDIFSQNQVFLEIAIPSILSGLVTDAGIYRLRGSYLWFQDRDRCPYVYTQFDHFYHAWKMSKFADVKQASFFCKEVLFRIDADLRDTRVTNTSS